MNNHNIVIQGETEFMISYELLKLIYWISQNEQISLKNIIKKALKNGLYSNIKDQSNTPSLQKIQNILIKFENLLFQAIQEYNEEIFLQKNKMPALNNINTTMFDEAILKFSIEKALYKRKNPSENPQELLFKELLKRWKTSKKFFH